MDKTSHRKEGSSENDTGYAPPAWEFDAEVTRVFDNMLQRSVPQYEIMRQTCFDLACAFVQPDTDIVDLGCSRGEALAPLVHRFKEQNHFIGIEVSGPMLDASRQRFEREISKGIVDIREMDLRNEYPEVSASVTMAVLVIQFTPIEYRSHILKRIYENTKPGGALIIVEKVLGSSATMDQLMVNQYYRLKTHNGYTGDEIERKRLSLEGKLVPVTAAWNEELFKSAGFSEVECFWRWMNFSGWIAVRN